MVTVVNPGNLALNWNHGLTSNPGPFRDNPGQSDQAIILRAIYQMQQRYSVDPAIRYIASGIGQINGDNQLDKIRSNIIRWVMNRMRYVPDPLDTEYLVAPDKLLSEIRERDFAIGDCDDHVVLMNTLLNSLGIPAYPVGVRINGSPVWNHVVSGWKDNQGNWVTVDPCIKNRLQPIYTDKLVLDV